MEDVLCVQQQAELPGRQAERTLLKPAGLTLGSPPWPFGILRRPAFSWPSVGLPAEACRGTLGCCPSWAWLHASPNHPSHVAQQLQSPADFTYPPTLPRARKQSSDRSSWTLAAESHRSQGPELPSPSLTRHGAPCPLPGFTFLVRPRLHLTNSTQLVTRALWSQALVWLFMAAPLSRPGVVPAGSGGSGGICGMNELEDHPEF